MKGQYVIIDLINKEVMKDYYLESLFDTFKAMRPFFDYMSEILTTDLNGELIV